MNAVVLGVCSTWCMLYSVLTNDYSRERFRWITLLCVVWWPWICGQAGAIKDADGYDRKDKYRYKKSEIWPAWLGSQDIVMVLVPAQPGVILAILGLLHCHVPKTLPYPSFAWWLLISSLAVQCVDVSGSIWKWLGVLMTSLGLPEGADDRPESTWNRRQEHREYLRVHGTSQGAPGITVE
jgi:hypothetical protein